MIVSVERGFVFLSMPKCASHAIVDRIADAGDVVALGRSELKHTPYRDLERFILPWLESRLGTSREDLTVVSLFREPIEWLHSWYRYRSRRALANPSHKHHFRYTGGMTFDEFAAGWLSDPQAPAARVGSQAAFVADACGDVGPDRLFRYEEIGAALSWIGDRLGRRIKLKRRNVSPARPLEMSAETRRALERALRRDYEIYRAIGD